jgi:ABC-2 type transport system permease protein
VAAHLLRLRIALLVGALRGDPRHVARVVVGTVLLVAATVVGCWGLLSLQDARPQVALVVTVTAGTALTLGFALAPLIAGATDQLDPRRFAVLGMAPRPLAASIALAGLVSVPVLCVLALSVCLAVMWTRQGVPWLAGAVAVILGVVTCALLSRVCMAIAAMFLRDRRSRELTGVFVVLLLVVVVPVGVFFASLEWGGRVPSQLDDATAVLADTPFGAAWAFPARLATGASSAWLSLAVAIVTVAALGVLWVWIVDRMLSTTERPVSGREHAGLGWFAVAPGTPGGAVAARSLVYWLRDRRYLVNMLVIPVAGALAMVPLLIAGVPFEYVILVPAPLMALFFGWLPHNDLAYDSTAVWLHFASAVRGVSDRVGRLVPVLLVGIPVLAVVIPLTISLHGRWAVLPAMVGVCASLFLGGLGLSSIASVVAPYPVSAPGQSPFQQPQRAGAGGALSQAVVLLGAVVVSAPTLWWGWLTLDRSSAYAVSTLWLGLGVGLAVLLIGVGVGSLVFERRGSRIMEFAEAG